MEEQKVMFEIAKLAKEKGFDDYYRDCYDQQGIIIPLFRQAALIETVFCSAPTQSLLQRWLREVHNIYVNSDYYQGYPEVRFYYDIKILIDDNYNGNQDSDDAIYTYEQAMELGLQEALKLIEIVKEKS